MSAPPLRDSRRLRRRGGERLPALNFDEDEDEEEEELSRRNVKHLACQLNVSIEDAVLEFERVGIRVESRFHDTGRSFRDASSRRTQGHHGSKISDRSSLRLPKL